MKIPHRKLIQRSPLTLALAAALFLPVAHAQEQAAQDQAATTTDEKTKDLDKVTVTGSLIPQTTLETFTPVTIISAEDIQARGFNTVAEVLQSSSFATGGVQNNQSSASFTQGAETLSLFGLSASYMKYLIDGRPMANYPALYNGSDVFNNISGIPVELVERIEILPGGQSSLYGSDAIAGVVNIILKKNIDGAMLSARFGGYDEGGGQSGRISFADGFSAVDDKLNVVYGIQAEKTNPVWGYQRDLTSQFNTEGTTGCGQQHQDLRPGGFPGIGQPRLAGLQPVQQLQVPRSRQLRQRHRWLRRLGRPADAPGLRRRKVLRLDDHTRVIAP